MIYPLAPNGIFWTLQGEGALVGEPMAFIRLAGCSVGCAGCDTDYRVARRVELELLVKEVQHVSHPSILNPWVWVTGGEPTDHDLGPLVGLLQTIGFKVALATSGIRRVDSLNLQWISVSPHSSSIVQRTGHELKIVPHLNGLTWKTISEEIVRWSFPYRYIQPLWRIDPDLEDGTNLKQCIDFVMTHPGWRLGMQAHKSWGLP